MRSEEGIGEHPSNPFPIVAWSGIDCLLSAHTILTISLEECFVSVSNDFDDGMASTAITSVKDL